MIETKNIVCTVCDLNCMLKATVQDGEIVDIGGPSICSKVMCYNEYMNHPDRLLYPLKNVGKRGEQKWQRISWEQALDEIAQRLQACINKYGGETFALSIQPTNTGRDQGMVRRFMNLLGSPNFITGLHMCVGNTIQVHRVTYGTNSTSVFENANCILYVGHNPHKDNWVGEADKLAAAQRRGAKLIVLDPRESETAKIADIHLPLRYGTDAAMLLGFLNVIIEEKLYDKNFVEKYTYGFDKLSEQVKEYPLSRVAQITGCDPQQIAAAARLYATHGPSIIPWGPIPDMQVNGTSTVRCQDILMSICGYLNKSETLQHPAPDLITASELELHEKLPIEQKLKQLGTEKYPLMTYKGYELLQEPNRRVYGLEWYQALASFMANPAAVFRAMRTAEPYPVRAFFNIGSNALMGYTNQQGVLEGLMKQELVVVMDHWLTPTAQLADYVLPSDYYLERPGLRNQDHISGVMLHQQCVEPKGECKGTYFLLKGLADRMGLSEYFPWKNMHELFNHRLSRLGKTWGEIENDGNIAPSRKVDPLASENGFATPTGKIELYSTVLKQLGYDPLPHYLEPAQTAISAPVLAREYPLTLFSGYRDAGNYLTNLHQIPSLRKISPYPEAFVNPADGVKYGVKNGEWIWVETTHGRMMLLTKLDDAQPKGTIRVPHGWWMPELPPGPETGFSGAMVFNDALVIPDDDWNTDAEQGIPNLRGGLLAKIYPVEE